MMLGRFLLAVGFGLVIAAFSSAQAPGLTLRQKDAYSTSNCMGCHGQTAMGGLGGPIAQTKLTYQEVLGTVRNGKGMMPATSTSQMPDEVVARIYEQLKGMPYDETQIPLAFRVGDLLKTKNTFKIFAAVFGVTFLVALWRLFRWLHCAAIADLWPRIAKFGIGRSAVVVFRSLVLDGLLVQSLWKVDRRRWIMHGLMLYGFIGLIIADILFTIYNPGRGDLPMLSPLKLLPMVSGMMVFTGVLYVMFRYRSDAYIDNGHTLGADFLFVSLLFHTVLSGFLTFLINRLGLNSWVMPTYIYHLVAICALILTAPFSRFQHAWIVPTMAALTRLTEAVTQAQVDLGFEREPSPGRHHKSERIAACVLKNLGPETASEDFQLRYYP